MNLTTARIFLPFGLFRHDLCHRFAAIASAKSQALSSAVNGLSTMFGDQLVHVVQTVQRFWDSDMDEAKGWTILWGDRPGGLRKQRPSAEDPSAAG